jgi:hypothetical protein
MFLTPVIGFVIGFASMRFNGRLTVGMIVTLGLAFTNLMSNTARTTGHIDVMHILPPALTIGAFLLGLGLRRVLMLFMSTRWH